MADLPIVCTLPSPELRARRNELVRFVAREARERTAHGEGYRLRFDPTWALLRDLLELIEVERHCCAFLTFRLEVTPGNGPVWPPCEYCTLPYSGGSIPSKQLPRPKPKP